MAKKNSVCVLVVVFVGLFLACSWPTPKEEPLNLVTLDSTWTQIVKGESFPWDSIDGFFPNKEHKYGFDRYPVSENMGKYVSIGDIGIGGITDIADSIINETSNCGTQSCEDEDTNIIWNYERGRKNTDSIVYISILDGDSGKVNLKINQDFGSSLKLYDYYICKPDYPYEIVATIDNSEKEIPYTISSVENKIALCKESEVGPQKVQELEISSYGWKLYDFYVYILGDSTDGSERHQLLNSTNFWDLFDSVYAQAVVKHDSSRLFGEFKAIDRGYVLTKANGDYSGCSYSSDIDNAIKEVRTNVKNRGVERNIIQVGYPTKRVWPLKVDVNGDIQICGKPAEKENPLDFKLKLEILPYPNCSEKIEASVKRDEDRGVWMLEYKDGRQEDAKANKQGEEGNVDPECMVFAEIEAKNSNYVGEVKILGNSKTRAIMEPYFEFSLFPLYLAISKIVILPWLEDSTAKTALHELGHSIGLMDMDNISPSYVGEDNNEENNLMVHIGDMNSLKLRKRGILTIDGIAREGFIVLYINGLKYNFRSIEYQWDCLHGKSKACTLSIY